MKRFCSFLIVICLLLGGCTAAPQQGETSLSFRDSAGQTISLAHRPQRVAVLFSSLAQLWQLAGGSVGATVGESVERGFCEAGICLVDGGAGKTIDNEALLTYAPDLVIGSTDVPAHQDTAALLQKAGIPCALMRVETFEDYLAALKSFTAITGDANAYQTHGVDLQKQIDGIIHSAKGVNPPKILFIRSGSKASSAKAKTADQHFAAAMLQELGAINIADAAPLLMDGLSIEAVLKEDPDHIFISTMGDEQAAKTYMDSVLAQPSWQALGAVKNRKYTYLPKDLFQYKPNARWAEAYQTLAEILYPELSE